MNTFVGAEYVMANTLIALKRKGEESITFERLREIGFQIQTSFNEKGLDAVILTSGDNISAAILISLTTSNTMILTGNRQFLYKKIQLLLILRSALSVIFR